MGARPEPLAGPDPRVRVRRDGDQRRLGADATAEHDLPPLRRAVRAAVAYDIEPVLAVYQLSSSTPDTSDDRAAFAAYTAGLARALPSVREVIVGNEPNLNLFWQPQFGTDGSDIAAASYEALLAATYDALKALATPPDGDRWRPRSARRRRCGGTRQTHSRQRSSAISVPPIAQAAGASR